MIFPFALYLAVALLALPRQQRTFPSALRFASISLLWCAASFLSGDRRLFFPFSLALAFQVFAVRGLFLSCGMVALFTVIRLLQNATLFVLAVELLLTLPALGLPLWLYSRSPKNPPRRLYYTALTSLLAFAGLAF
jgi:hypothetical protein